MSGDDLTRPENFGHLADVLPEGTWVALIEPSDLRDQGRQYLARADDPRGLFTVEATVERLLKRPSITLAALAASSLETTCHLRIESIERFSGELTKVKAGSETLVDAMNNLQTLETTYAQQQGFTVVAP